MVTELATPVLTGTDVALLGLLPWSLGIASSPSALMARV